MVGRTRKTNVKRYPGGQIKHEDRGNGDNGECPDDVALWPRIKREAKKAAQNPILESEIGRLAYHNKITAQELDAGKEWKRLVHVYRQFGLGSANGIPKIASMEPSCKPTSLDLDDLDPKERQELVRETNAIKRDYEKARAILLGQWLGRETMLAVCDLCLYDECLTHERRILARAGLKALARHFGFAKRA